MQYGMVTDKSVKETQQQLAKARMHPAEERRFTPLALVGALVIALDAPLAGLFAAFSIGHQHFRKTNKVHKHGPVNSVNSLIILLGLLRLSPVCRGGDDKDAGCGHHPYREPLCIVNVSTHTPGIITTFTPQNRRHNVFNLLGHNVWNNSPFWTSESPPLLRPYLLAEMDTAVEKNE